MNYLGLLGEYPVNRYLNDIEIANKLEQKTKLNIQPAHQLSTIKINSQFIELVDKYFMWKGHLAMFAMSAIVLFTAMIVGTIVTGFTRPGGMSGGEWVVVFVLLIGVPPILFFFSKLKKEAFAYTHYPIRLNRQTRMVHVFRVDGTVLSVPWDEVFFCIASAGKGNWEIQGHILGKDKKTVFDTFAFMLVTSSKSGSSVLKNYWEFVRRYMEEGPESVIEGITAYLPISDQRETFVAAFRRMHFTLGAGFFILEFLILLIYLIIYPARWFAMRTSKIPQWPKEIEAQCPVEDNDPYARDYRNNLA
ncbi:DUF6708 domain-containing protein [Iodobacter sp. CM08]|uniref:DUF6708 domain-containing protein n=1 Tax=Iodobacter sp. CM08 TaxID=3085902 RepID=UPI002980A413|nr:DUF6708 domain-containing protein [Iodobacter sp. CM08]MDW5417067.1 DUF6708 domain-containing protein [Iodobacter sp. CM08]